MKHRLLRVRPWSLVLLLNVLYLSVILAANGGDPQVFVTIGECFDACAGVRDTADCVEGTEGYDGQFAYYIARDPLHSADCIDVPAYRYQRILLPALGAVFSMGQDVLIPWAFVGINLAALVIGTALLEDLLVTEGASRWYALGYGLFAGVFMAVRLSTTEALAYGLVIGAIWCARWERIAWAALLLALAGLAKETTGLFTAGFILTYVLQRHWRDAVLIGLAVGLPFVAWQVVLARWLGAFGIGSGGAMATPFELIPYMGVWRIGLEGGLLVFLVLGVLLAIPAAVVPSVWALWRTLGDLRDGRWSLYSNLLLANAAVMPFLPFSTYREFLGLLRFIPGLVLMVILYAAREKHRRPLLYSTLWIVLLLFVIAG